MQKLIEKLPDRIDVFDLLRGYFVLVLVIDHLERWPGIFDWITGQAKLWGSAAEGFFIVSGIMIGLVRGRRMMTKPFKLVSRLLIVRGVQLYLWAVLTSLFFTLWTLLWFKYTGNYDLGFAFFTYKGTSGWDIVSETFLLSYSHGWTGFLKYYALYIALAPVVVWLLRKGLWWLVLTVSASVWLYGLDKDNWWLSWQLLFYGGAVIGYHAMQIRNWWTGLANTTKTIISASVYLTALITLSLSVFMTFGWSIVKQPDNPFMTFNQYVELKKTVDPMFDIVSLQPLRVAVSALWFSALLLLFSKFEIHIKKYLGWLLMTFGRNSLYVYILHGVFAFAFNMALMTRQYFFANVAIILFTVLALWWLTRKGFLMKFIPR